MNQEELEKLSEEEIYKLYNLGKISKDKLVELIPRWDQDKLKDTQGDILTYLKNIKDINNTIKGWVTFFGITYILGILYYLLIYLEIIGI